MSTRVLQRSLILFEWLVSAWLQVVEFELLIKHNATVVMFLAASGNNVWPMSVP